MDDEIDLPLAEQIEIAERKIEKTQHELVYWREARRKLCAKRYRQQVKSGLIKPTSSPGGL